MHNLSTQGCQHKDAACQHQAAQVVNTRLSAQGCTACQPKDAACQHKDAACQHKDAQVVNTRLHRMSAQDAGCQHKASGVTAISKFPMLCATSQRPPPSTSSTSAKIFPRGTGTHSQLMSPLSPGRKRPVRATWRQSPLSPGRECPVRAAGRQSPLSPGRECPVRDAGDCHHCHQGRNVQ